MEVERVDFVAVPTRDRELAVAFYGEVLGLRQDEHRSLEFWAGETCLNIWEPAAYGVEFQPQKNAHIAFRVPDVAAARAELESKGIEFEEDTVDTGVCHIASFTDADGNDLMLHHRYAPHD